MKVTFITRRLDHDINSLNITILNPDNLVIKDISKWFTNTSLYSNLKNDIDYHNGWYVFGQDIETRTEVQPSKRGLLLSSFTIDGNHVLCIDNTSVDNNELFTHEVLRRCLFIAHNADFEARYGIVSDFMPMRYGCTLVNSKRLCSGMEGLKFDLISEINRRLSYDSIPEDMDKDIRNEFATCTYFRDDHILYNAADTIRLKDVYYEQRRLGDELGMSFLLNSLNSRIIPEIAATEIRGIKHNSEKWLQIARDRKDKADKICQELNELITNQYKVNLEVVNPALRKERESLERRELKLQERKQKLENQLKLLEEKGKTHLKSYQTQLEQLQKLGDYQTDVSSLGTEQLINWGSQKQVLEVFKQIGCPIPQAKKEGKIKDGLGKEARANWWVKYENSSYFEFFNRYDKFKKLAHNISSFGEEWINKYVRNGRAFTMFDIAGAATGRHTSGSKGKVKTHFNISQIPGASSGTSEYRECFEADEGRRFIKIDFKNQEGVLIISMSGDLEMKKITSQSDQHSYLGTKAWREVYRYRFDQTKDPKWKELSETYVMDKSTPEKEKERQKFKNSAGLFPVLYACTPDKVASTAQVTAKEGEIMINSIKSHAPKAYDFLSSKAKEAIDLGYVIHNNRSGSRRWFQAVLDHKHYGYPLSKSAKTEIELGGRNTAIQGTGSCIMKEAIAMIALWRNLFKQDLEFVLSNYDEYVASVPEDEAERYYEVIKDLMIRAAKNYLTPIVEMEIDGKISKTW